MPRTGTPIERKNPFWALRSLLKPTILNQINSNEEHLFCELSVCHFLIHIIHKNSFKEEIYKWLCDNIQTEDFKMTDFRDFGGFETNDIEFRNQEDMNLFMLSWAGRIQIDIIVNEP